MSLIFRTGHHFLHAVVVVVLIAAFSFIYPLFLPLTKLESGTLQVVLAKEYFLCLEHHVPVVIQFVVFSFVKFARTSTMLWSSFALFLV